MSDGDLARVRVRIHSTDGFNLAELGALCTAVNRTLQVAAGSAPANLAHEPRLIEVQVESVERGSVVISTLLNFFNNQVAQDAFLAAMLGNAGFELLGLLARNVSRAFERTGQIEEHVRIEPVMGASTEQSPKLSTSANSQAMDEEEPHQADRKVTVQLTVIVGNVNRHLEVRARVSRRRSVQR